MRIMKLGLLNGIILAVLSFHSAAFACSTAGWLGGTNNIPGNGSADSPPTISRYSELCALEVTDTSYVQSNLASDTRYRVRFYVLNGLTGSGDVDIFEAYSAENGTGSLFKVSLDGSQFTFDASAAGGSSTAVAASSGWNLVELDWDSVGGTLSIWVNADATTDSASGSTNSGTGTVESVRLGAPNGFSPQTGKLTFDAFESHRETAVGALLAGDANNDGNVNSGDIITVINEYFDSNNLGVGQPDCNGDGNVNSGDIICVINKYFGV